MTTEDIHNICLKYKIENYTINDDLSIDVEGDVDLFRNNLKELPLRFRDVSGTFECSWNQLTSLEGAPSSIGGKFICYSNPLESLKGITIDVRIVILPYHFTYSDYLAYCNSYHRDLKFKKLLKCL